MSGRQYPPPPEVVLDYHRVQVLARTDAGEPFAQYALCDGGCGWLIGCGDAIDTISHESCVAESVSSRAAKEPNHE